MTNLKRTMDKRRSVELTSGEYRLLNDLTKHDTYMGQSASEDTLRTALQAGLVKIIGHGEFGKPYVSATKKGEQHQARSWAENHKEQ